MSVLDNNTIGTLEQNINVGEMFLPDNHIALVASYGSICCYPYILGDDIRLYTTFQGLGATTYIFVNGNNIFSQVCMLLGLGAAAYRLDDGVFLNVQKADVDTVDIVDVDGTPTEVTGQHKPSEILIFRSKK
jgi:hypothetical protein